MQINLKEGWIAKTMVYSSGAEQWEFFKDKPDGVPEMWDAASGQPVGGQLIRIMYVEVPT